MEAAAFYRIAVNKESEIYAHFEPCGNSLEYAEKEFKKICDECQYGNDLVELQVDNIGEVGVDTPGDFRAFNTGKVGNWVTIKTN